jgi:hypothetical protein
MLRTVHLLFMTCATLLALFLAAWAFDQYAAGAPVHYAGGAIAALAAAVGLAIYGLRFRRRSRSW